MKHCATCGREFKPSSKHRDCPACRAVAAKRPCPGCGTLIRPKSKACRSCFSRVQYRGSENPNWKGDAARHVNQQGYIYRRRIGHPRGIRNGWYVLEHILVMEDMLGRYLLPGEQVHHRNGRRDDNRPENLELWVRGQPNGARVEDAIGWAREVLARYTDDPPHGGGGSLSSDGGGE